MTRHRLGLFILASLAVVATHAADDSSAPLQPTAKLAPDEIAKAAPPDRRSVPTPGELFMALDKVAKPNWQTEYRAPVSNAFTNRPQIALNLGGLIADGYLAIEAEDPQQVKNIGNDLVALSRSLGVSENVLRRERSIEDLADHNAWNELREQLDAVGMEIKSTMESKRDEELVILVTLGMWIRGIEIVSDWMVKNYSLEAAELLRQPAVATFLQTQLDMLPEKVRNDALIKTINDKLRVLAGQLSFPRGTIPTLPELKTILETSHDLVQIISKK